MNDETKRIEKEKKRWEREVVSEALKNAPESRKEFRISSGAPVKRIYTPADLETDYLRDIGFPGEYPFTRGVQPTMYRGRLWTMRQYAGFGTAEDTNRRYKYLLEQGQTGLSVAFDLPTQIGYDSDHQMAGGEVGKVGVAISSLRDMEVLFNGISLEKVSTSMTINSTASVLLAMYLIIAENQGGNRSRLSGTIQNDILKEYVARGTYIFPPKESMRIITDIFEFCSREMPRWNTISISGYHIREAGSTAVQEVAFTLANGIAYVQAAVDRGLNVDSFASRLSFFFNAHNNFLEEIAKFRAARSLWAELMKERFGAKDPKSWQLRFHTQTAGCALTAQEPENNVTRVTLQALAAVLGGTQSLHTNSMDEALSLPTENAVRVALRTQQIISYESDIVNTIDPFAGSYYIEWLTDDIRKGAKEYIARIDDMGGVLAAIEKGYIQNEIAQSAYNYQRDVEKGENVVVGVNRFRSDGKEKYNVLKVNPEIEERRRDELRALRGKRDNGKVKESLANLKKEAQGKGNMMPVIIGCVKHYATLGEICDELRGVFGEYKPKTMI